MLNNIAKDMWLIEGHCVDFHGFPYPTRSVVIRLSNGDLWYWSPIQFSEALATEMEQLGPVHHLVSPNKIHHLFLSDWHTRFPAATLWGPNSTQKKRHDLCFDSALTDSSPIAWSQEIEQFHVTGSLAMDEILFLHLPSRTLIVADFSENFSIDFLQQHWQGWQRRLARLWGIVEGKGYAPLDWRASFFNRGAIRKLKKQLLQRDIDKVIMAHGQIQLSNGREYLEKSLSWIS